MGHSRRNRNKRNRNPAVAPPLPVAPRPPPSAAPGGSAAAAPDQPVENVDLEYELAVEQRQGDQETVDMNLDLQGNFRDCRVYLEDLNRSKSLITGAEFKEAYAKKWIRNAKEALLSLIYDIEQTEMKIRIREGKAMPRPAEIQEFITLVNRSV